MGIRNLLRTYNAALYGVRSTRQFVQQLARERKKAQQRQLVSTKILRPSREKVMKLIGKVEPTYVGKPSLFRKGASSAAQRRRAELARRLVELRRKSKVKRKYQGPSLSPPQPAIQESTKAPLTARMKVAERISRIEPTYLGKPSLYKKGASLAAQKRRAELAKKLVELRKKARSKR